MKRTPALFTLRRKIVRASKSQMLEAYVLTKADASVNRIETPTKREVQTSQFEWAGIYVGSVTRVKLATGSVLTLDVLVCVGSHTYEEGVHDYGKRYTLLQKFLHDRDDGTTCAADSAFYCPKALHAAKRVWQKKKRLVFTVPGTSSEFMWLSFV